MNKTITIAEDGTVTLGDGRTIHTTAATAFKASDNVVFYLPYSDQPRYAEQCRGHRAISMAAAMDRLYAGQTVAMQGTAEGRLLDGRVVTTTLVWCVCAL